ncbi:hypothetical protein F2Q68_00045480 [Brassica cretica]|uniref:Uncharacterized protein n=2 Tax=Brassica cretica TaxID=69181 RepID=A0A8S9LM57_BRACR|nr:hypothetical protein F2Q68_00045480 [Brassica cretica]KAF3518208.1 hypothetical protein DY000_02062354 [Brassica cretica]
MIRPTLPGSESCSLARMVEAHVMYCEKRDRTYLLNEIQNLTMEVTNASIFKFQKDRNSPETFFQPLKTHLLQSSHLFTWTKKLTEVESSGPVHSPPRKYNSRSKGENRYEYTSSPKLQLASPYPHHRLVVSPNRVNGYLRQTYSEEGPPRQQRRLHVDSG